jgi:hypothetical protein
MEINLGKDPFKKFTKSALVGIIEDALMTEKERSLPAHKRGKKDRKAKDDSTEDADRDREDLADLHEEMKGSPAPIHMDDEDLSDESMDVIESELPKTKKSKKSPKKK